jgi:hypothetical protein
MRSIKWIASDDSEMVPTADVEADLTYLTTPCRRSLSDILPIKGNEFLLYPPPPLPGANASNPTHQLSIDGPLRDQPKTNSDGYQAIDSFLQTCFVHTVRMYCPQCTQPVRNRQVQEWGNTALLPSLQLRLGW